MYSNRYTLFYLVAKLSLSEDYEISASECMDKMMNNLPPITLVDPLCVMCSSKHDNNELRTAGLNAISLLPSRFAKELKVKLLNRNFRSSETLHKFKWFT